MLTISLARLDTEKLQLYACIDFLAIFLVVEHAWTLQTMFWIVWFV